jgi:hypothetical protein
MNSKTAETKPRKHGPSYSVPEVALVVSRFAASAALVERTDRRKASMIEAQLADIEGGLERIPDVLYEALTLRGLKRHTNVDAAQATGVHPNTMSRRFMRGLRWLTDYLNDPCPLERLREVEWRSWAAEYSQSVLDAVEREEQGGPGRPPEIAREVDERVLGLHCAGSSERSIVEVLSREFPRADGREWSRSSVRSVLRRYRAPTRPRGRRVRRGHYRPGDITQPNYREIEFGEPLCDPEELLSRGRR